ncbi:MAG: hypothetical protein Q4D22_03100 [Candidatus Saccharibacteria bacterium]|nr:hypothetical protein [Candidatus Saccharibacteria bacterium]
MADRIDSEKIKLIRVLKSRAKRSGTDRFKLLAKKDELYEKAIRSQYNAGFFTLICGVLGLIVTMIFAIKSNIDSGISVDVLSYAIIAAAFLGIIIPICLKTMSLTTTPTVMLVMTIIQLILTILCFAGILPLIALIFNIIALVRWSTYRNWYEEVSVAYYKGEKPAKVKVQKAHKPKDMYDFSDTEEEYEDRRKQPIGLIVALVFAIILGICGCIGCFYWGRNGGWIDGYNAGKNDGLNEGHENGYSEGWDAAKASEWQYGQTRYQAGYNDGYRKAGCVIWGGAYCN